MTEIERKFLLKNTNFKSKAKSRKYLVQAYLNTHPERTIRVRVEDDRAFLTVKGKTSENGLSRFEWEKEITVSEADQLLKICEPGKIEKYRYLVEAGEHIYEVDEFLGENEGLLIAEVELNEEDEEFVRPDWLGEEVTGDIKYYNSHILKNPFKNWRR